MERKEGWVKTDCVRILWAVLAVLLCAAPYVQADVIVPAEQEWDINYDVEGFLKVYGIANLDTGAYAAYGIKAYPGSTVNIRGGTIGAASAITVFAGPPAATVTVYGTDFVVTTGTIEDGSWTPVGGSGILTGEYENGNPEDPEDDINLLFHSDTPIILVDTGGPSTISVQIDIKPGSDPNPINQGSNGLIPVAILTTDDFDASTVDPGTVTLNGADVTVRGKSEKLMARLEDVDGDGDEDLMLQVETDSWANLGESGDITLYGTTYDGQAIKGTDYVVIVPPQ